MQNRVNSKAMLLTVEQTAEYLGLAISTLNNWRHNGEGPGFIKLGRAVRYRQSDLDAYIELQYQNCTASV